jgi:hypothetical protein
MKVFVMFSSDRDTYLVGVLMPLGTPLETALVEIRLGGVIQAVYVRPQIRSLVVTGRML